MDRQKNWHCSKETGNGKLDSTKMVSCATQGMVKIVGYDVANKGPSRRDVRKSTMSPFIMIEVH